VYLSAERLVYKFYGIDSRPNLDAKLIDSIFHRRREVFPAVNNPTHRFFDGSEHFFHCNITVGSRHSTVASFFYGSGRRL